MITFKEIKEKLLAACDEITILEVLDIRIEEILDRFEDKLEEKLDALNIEFEDDEEYDD